jgi:hypothetical protein
MRTPSPACGSRKTRRMAAEKILKNLRILFEDCIKCQIRERQDDPGIVEDEKRTELAYYHYRGNGPAVKKKALKESIN